MMLSRDQVLALIRERAHHPATVRELLQVLKISREHRATFRRHLKALVANGDLIKIRGNRFGLADRMDVVVGRLETHAPGSASSCRTAATSASLHRAHQPHGSAARRPRRRTRRTPARRQALEGRIIRILERANSPRRPVRGGRVRPWIRGAFRPAPACRRAGAVRRIPRGAAPGTWCSSRSRDGRRHASAARTRHRSARSDRRPGVDTRIIIRKHNIPDAHGEAAVAEAQRLGGTVRARDIAGAHRLPGPPDGHDRRRARTRFRRRHHDRAVAERSLLAGRPHRGRVALRGGGQRARFRSLRAGHVGLLPGAGGAHVSVGTGHGTLLTQSARGSAGAVLPDGGHAQRRGRRVPSSTTASSTAPRG